ncbi:rCG46713 [Rattus norvegicus]|uniref:RCG46713 n=1 Tax=Rattus norvegicus TaxID=10116 RepID=A6IWY9_RAT|nr:rCG46713 [Rattus norvegicus]
MRQNAKRFFTTETGAAYELATTKAETRPVCQTKMDRTIRFCISEPLN